MEKKKQKRRYLNAGHWRTKIAVGLVAALLTANAAPAAISDRQSRQNEVSSEEMKATEANASKADAYLKTQMQSIGVPGSEETKTQAVEESGKIGSLNWEFKENTLTISGSGEMNDFDWTGAVWCNKETICNHLEYVVVEDGVTGIGSYAFNNCKNLISVRLPKSITRIGRNAFSRCTALERIELPEKVTEILPFTFLQCTSLHGVTLPKGLTRIRQGAFSECTGLREITLPETVCEIEKHAFWETAISSAVIPKSVEFLGLESFSEGTKLTFRKLEDAGSKALIPTGNKSFVRGSNNHEQDYPIYHAAVINSYLYEGENGTFYRVVYRSEQLVIEQYQSDYRFIQSWTVPVELSRFGGFYAGEDALYIVFGQDNLKESDTKEVIRVVKYSKTMERLLSASLYGENTTKPFNASGLRMAEDGDYLYIRTGHERYKSSDGKNHQASMLLILNTEAMICSYIGDNVQNDLKGVAISHSFNQFVAVDGNHLVLVDHGDSGPRKVVMNICPKTRIEKDDGNLDNAKAIPLLSISGNYGDNYTGVTVGGLEVSDTAYLVAGNTINQSRFTTSKTRNIFLSVADKVRHSSRYIQVTDYEEGGIYNSSTPQMVKLSEDLFVVMWEELVNSRYSGIIKAAFFNGEGEQLGNKKIYSFEGELSDCQPVLLNGRATWFVVSGEELKFYCFPAQFPGSADIKAEKTTLTIPERSVVLPAIDAGKITQSSVTLNKAVVDPAESIYDGTLEYGWALENNIFRVKNWQSGTEFTGLQSGKTYYFFAQILGGKSYKNALSGALTVTTKSSNSGDSGSESENQSGNGSSGSSGDSSSSGSSGNGGSSGSSGNGGSSGSSGNGGSHGTVSVSNTSGGPGTQDTSSPFLDLPSYVETGEWMVLNGIWHFVDAAGKMKMNTWTAAYNPYASAGQQNYDWFRFDAYGNMLTGWFLDYDGNWYFLNPFPDGTQGRMLTGWVWVADRFGVQRCYYFNPVSDGYRGKMLTNTVVDGYTIDAGGCWTVNGIQQIK